MKVRESRVVSNAVKLPPRPNNVSNKVERRERSPSMIP